MKNTRLTVFLILLLATTAVLVLRLYAQESRPEALPVVGAVAPFQLEDSKGRSYSSAQLKDKVWIADFFFTSCPNVCLIKSHNMAKLSRTFAAVKNVELVSITIDPLDDSPQALERYAQQFPGEKDNWVFLTGGEEAIRDLAAKSFRLVNVAGPMVHGSYLVLVDRGFRIRGYYDGTKTSELDRLFRDTAHLSMGAVQ